MQGFDLQQFDLLSFVQTLKPLLFVKWAFILLVFGYGIFQFIIYRQIKSMEKIITQPLSSAIVSFISLLLIGGSILLLLIAFGLPI